MEIRDIADLLKDCCNYKNNEKMKHNYIDAMYEFFSKNQFDHLAIENMIKGIDIDEGMTTINYFELINDLPTLNKAWGMINVNRYYSSNEHGNSYKFLCVALSIKFKNKEMTEYQWTQVIPQITKFYIDKDIRKSMINHEQYMKKYFFDDIYENTFLPNIKKIKIKKNEYENFIRLLRTMLESKMMREEKNLSEGVMYIKKWITPFLEDIKKKEKKSVTEKNERNKEVNSNQKNKNLERKSENKSERMIVIVNPDNIGAMDEEQEIISDVQATKDASQSGNVEKVSKISDSKSVISEDSTQTNSNEQEVHQEVNEVIENKDEDKSDLKSEISNLDSENEKKKKTKEKKASSKKSKKKSDELKGLLDYFEKLEIIAEENDKELKTKNEEIEKLNKKISELEINYNELQSEKAKLNLLVLDKDKAFDELSKKLEESMKMNLSFETIKVNLKEDLRKDIGNALRNIYEDYMNSVSENMDIELGQIYREKIGEIFQMLEKEGVKVEL